MRIVQRYKKLSFWNKLGTWGSLASIIGLAIYFLTGFLHLIPAVSSGVEVEKKSISNSSGESRTVEIHALENSPVIHNSGNFTVHQIINERPLIEDQKPNLNIAMHRQKSQHAYEFTLSNTNNGIAIVESIGLEVLDVIEDKYVQTGALIPRYEYIVKITHDFRGTAIFAKDFKYSSGESDIFSVLLEHECGYDYILRFVVNWYNPTDKELKKTHSEIFVDYCPAGGEYVLEFAPDWWREEAKKHYKKVQERVQKLKSSSQ